MNTLFDIYQSTEKNDVLGVIRTLYPNYDMIGDKVFIKRKTKEKKK
jgi:hypothetical protein